MINISKRFKLILLIVILFLITIIIVRSTQKTNIPDDGRFNNHLVDHQIKRNKFIIPVLRESNDDLKLPKRNELVNLTNFNYKISNRVCDKFKDNDLLGIIIITSYVGHDDVRSSHRQAISQHALAEMGFARVFLIAEIPSDEKFITQKAIEEENKLFGDLIQGNFIENYKNLTYKHVMGLKWVIEMCSKAEYIIKVDDDIVFDIYHLNWYLTELEHDHDELLLAGFILSNLTPIRLEANKWFVTEDEFKDPYYPDYISGWLYITNVQTAKSLVINSKSEKFFWIDDIYVTGILGKDINLTPMNDWFSANVDFIRCCIKDVIKSFLKCDYHVGPNGGDNKLIIKFTKTMEQCRDDFCEERNPKNSLNSTCVGEIQDILTNRGSPVVKEMKL